MKIFVITMFDSTISREGFDNLVLSAALRGIFASDITCWNAVTSLDEEAVAVDAGLFTKPREIHPGVILNPYKARNVRKVIACALSHKSLWEYSVKHNENIVILEHDAHFTRFCLFPNIVDGTVMSLNDPLGCTFNSTLYNRAVLSAAEKVPLSMMRMEYGSVPAPYIADRSRPQGLPGNSAYIMTPKAAKKALKLIEEKGLMPNDALLCNQLFENELFCASNYVTRIQGLRSTTTT